MTQKLERAVSEISAISYQPIPVPSTTELPMTAQSFGEIAHEMSTVAHAQVQSAYAIQLGRPALEIAPLGSQIHSTVVFSNHHRHYIHTKLPLDYCGKDELLPFLRGVYAHEFGHASLGHHKNVPINLLAFAHSYLASRDLALAKYLAVPFVLPLIAIERSAEKSAIRHGFGSDVLFARQMIDWHVDSFPIINVSAEETAELIERFDMLGDLRF